MTQFPLFVTKNEIKKGLIKGTFKKYLYVNNGLPHYIYCHSDNDFKALIDYWNQQVKQFWYNGIKRYSHTYRSSHGELIALDNIPEDQNHKMKVYLCDQDIHYIQ